MRDLNGLQKNTAKGQIIVFAFLSIFFIVGIVCLAIGGYLAYKSARSSSWPSTDGILKTVATVSSWNSNLSTTYYSPEVTYDYMVNGQLFTGNKLRIIELGRSDSAARERIKEYKVGEKVKVFYSPTDFTNSVLEPGMHPSCLFLPSIGLAFIAIPLILFVVPHFIVKGRQSKIKKNCKLITDN
jgi:hypothetical protein